MRKLLPLTVLVLPAVLMAQPAIERVSENAAGHNAEGRSSAPAVNRDGRFVAFYSDAPNLISGDFNGRRDVFVRDRQEDRVERIPSAPEPNGASQLGGFAPAISETGRFVSFSSNASNLVGGDSGQFED